MCAPKFRCRFTHRTSKDLSQTSTKCIGMSCSRLNLAIGNVGNLLIYLNVPREATSSLEVELPQARVHFHTLHNPWRLPPVVGNRPRSPHVSGTGGCRFPGRCVVVHALPEVRSPLEFVEPFGCPTCGQEVSRTIGFVSADRRVERCATPRTQSAAERQNGHVWRIDGQAARSLNYPAVTVPGGNVPFAAPAGRLSAGRLFHRYGNPDLMAEFAGQYLKPYRAIAPKGRLPQTMTEMMPALHLLLVHCAELALKADLIRSGKARGGHDLRALSRGLEDEHREEAERRFVDAAPNAPLNALGADRPTVENVLGMYEQGFGGLSAKLPGFIGPVSGSFRPDGGNGPTCIGWVDPGHGVRFQAAGHAVTRMLGRLPFRQWTDRYFTGHETGCVITRCRLEQWPPRRCRARGKGRGAPPTGRTDRPRGARHAAPVPSRASRGWRDARR